jgi:cell fate regulator YaaT (PSP1 superfamily)
MNKDDKNNNINQPTPNESERIEQQETVQNSAASTAAIEEEEDYVATAEEMEAFIKSRREKQKASKQNEKQLNDYDTEEEIDYEASGSAMDPYLEPDPKLPKVEYKEPLYLSRGCNHQPESYVPVSETELRSCCKVGACNWMKGIRQPMEKPFDCVEVRFKNNRKEFFRLPDGIDVSDGDIVAVEGIPGHDVGIVSLTGEVCRIQMEKKKINPESESIKKLFRRAKTSDIERWTAAIKEEESALKKTRHIAEEMGLVMKVNDVEYQGDHSKAIFYYTADDRVDFRNLIKVLAEQFHVRIEMKQIGVRQEAGKVGGIGTCGRELCCSTWLTNFKSVTTSVAKAQQILPNPQKLAGQCGKLKCCLNFEYAVYVDALKKFPPANTPIRFKKGLALYKKTDVFRGIMWYAYEGESDLYAITAENVKKIIEMNLNQEYPEKLEDYQVELMSTAALAQESSEAEFDRELKLMADDTSSDTTTTASDKQQRARDKDRDQRNKGNRDRRQPRDPKPHRDNNEPREPREQREHREHREPRQQRDNRNQRDNNRNKKKNDE